MRSTAGLVRHADGVTRCWWPGEDPLYLRYHDTEWGSPVTNDRRLFEKICLEGFQAGLSWLTILRKRPNFRTAFADFDMKVRKRQTVLRGEIQDQSALHGVLDRIRALGIEIVEVRSTQPK